MIVLVDRTSQPPDLVRLVGYGHGHRPGKRLRVNPWRLRLVLRILNCLHAHHSCTSKSSATARITVASFLLSAGEG